MWSVILRNEVTKNLAFKAHRRFFGSLRPVLEQSEGMTLGSFRMNTNSFDQVLSESCGVGKNGPLWHGIG
jgi:hypothetical protein